MGKYRVINLNRKLERAIELYLYHNDKEAVMETPVPQFVRDCIGICITNDINLYTVRHFVDTRTEEEDAEIS